jgi:serine/threonine protein kinase
VPEDTSELIRWLRAEMRRSDGELLGSGYQAVVHRYRGPHGDFVVKSAHDSTLGFVWRYALGREHRVYMRLAAVPGVPRSHGLIDNRHLVLDYIPGSSLRDHDAPLRDRERFFTELLTSIEAMHAAGVAHGDLKRKDNVVVGPDARLRHGVRAGVIFKLVAQMDYNAWTKLKHGRDRLDELPAEDAARYRPLWLERIARWIRIPWQKLTLRRPRQRWRARRKR